jgi:NTE family protein
VVINISPYRPAILKTNRLSDAIAQLVAEEDIRDTLIPFAAVASDLNSGRTVTLHSGSIREAITISSSIPGFIAPHIRDGQLLTDGAVTAAVPVETIQAMGADFSIAIDVGLNNLQPLSEPNILDIISRVDVIRGIHQTEQQLQKADICIHPDVKNAHWSEFYRFEEFIQAGIEATQAAIPTIRERLSSGDGFLHTVLSKFSGK